MKRKRLYQSILFLIFILFISQIILPVSPYIAYYANKTYIVKELCKEKNVPKSTCKGKCYLNKQVKEINKKEPRTNHTAQISHYESVWYLSVPNFHHIIQLYIYIKGSHIYVNNFPSSAYGDILTPPPQKI